MHPVCGSAEILTKHILVVLDRYCHYILYVPSIAQLVERRTVVG